MAKNYHWGRSKMVKKLSLGRKLFGKKFYEKAFHFTKSFFLIFVYEKATFIKKITLEG